MLKYASIMPKVELCESHAIAPMKHVDTDFPLDAEKEDVLMQEPRAGVLRPSFCLVRDDQLKMIVLAIRGTHSLKVRHHKTELCIKH